MRRSRPLYSRDGAAVLAALGRDACGSDAEREVQENPTAADSACRGVEDTPPPTPPTGLRRPNFLIVYTDDQRWDAVGVTARELGTRGRFPWMGTTPDVTPNMDRLATEGLRFRNAFVVASLCSPSRASMLTGQYGFRHGVQDNDTEFPPDSVTYASVLRNAGYATGFFGKWHMGESSGPRPGFDASVSYIGQGTFYATALEVFGAAARPTAPGDYVDDVMTDYTVDFIEQNKDRPFAAVVAYNSGRGTYQPPSRKASLFAGVDTALTPPPNLGVLAPYQDVAGASVDRPVSNTQYARSLSAADDGLGRLMDALEERSLDQDTVVVFMSENGDVFGEHGLKGIVLELTWETVDRAAAPGRTEHRRSFRGHVPYVFLPSCKLS